MRPLRTFSVVLGRRILNQGNFPRQVAVQRCAKMYKVQPCQSLLYLKLFLAVTIVSANGWIFDLATRVGAGVRSPHFTEFHHILLIIQVDCDRRRKQATSLQVFPDRMHFGRIFYNQARLATCTRFDFWFECCVLNFWQRHFSHWCPSGTDVQEGLATGHGHAINTRQSYAYVLLCQLIGIQNRQSHLLQHIAQFSYSFGINYVARGVSSFVLVSRVLLCFVAIFGRHRIRFALEGLSRAGLLYSWWRICSGTNLSCLSQDLQHSIGEAPH